MQAMVKLHSYYITNTSTELNYAHIDLTDFKFYKAVSESFNEFTDFSNNEINKQEDELNIFEYENDNKIFLKIIKRFPALVMK